MPVQAQALRCIRPDAVRSYNEAARLDATFYVVHGRLRIDPAEMPPLVRETPTPERIGAVIVGHSLTKQGFTKDFVAPLTLDLQCAGIWCARVANNTDVLAFVEETEAGLVLEMRPCGEWVHISPDAQMLSRVVACHTKGLCDEAD